jgi:surface antigen
VAVSAPDFVSRQPRYSSTVFAHLWGSGRRWALPACGLALALLGGGCSFSYQLGSLFEDKEAAASNNTGSLKPAVVAQPVSELGSDADLAFARVAVSEVLARGGKDASMPWENPRTGARGTVTPIASAYNQDGVVCHDFLASYVRPGSEAWLQGEACRQEGQWEVRNMRPWNRS